MSEKEMIEDRCKSEGLTIAEWFDDDDNGVSAKLGRFTVLNDDEEDHGLYAGDEGELTACVVGAEQYRNQRVSFTFTADGYDEGNEVHDLLVLEPC